MFRSTSQRPCGKAPIGIAVVADDLTGAGDTAIHFASAKGRMLLVDLAGTLPAGMPGDTHALAINTASRGVQSESAIESIHRAADWLNSLAVPLVYKKIDSQLRGLPGLEIETLRDRLGLRSAFIAPAYPKQGRTTREGVHLVHNLPVNQSEAARDPVTPVRLSVLPEIIKDQAGVKTGHIYLRQMDQGLASVCEAIQKLLSVGVKAITFDATSQRHLELVAEAGLDSFKGVLLAGSAGLAISVAKFIDCRATSACERIPAHRSLLFVCGSASGVLHRQADLLVAQGCCREVTIAPLNLVNADAWHQLVSAAAVAWKRGNLLIRFSKRPLVHDGSDAEQNLNQMAELVAQLTARKKPDGLFLSGGDTARKVLQRTHTGAVELKSQVLPGMVWGYIHKGLLEKVMLVLKSGSFGEGEDLLKLYKMWKKDRSENELQC